MAQEPRSGSESPRSHGSPTDADIGRVGGILSMTGLLGWALGGFGFGVIGALFGPMKYGILPDHLRREELPTGNALVEGATFIAILLGTIVGGLAAHGEGSTAAFAVLVMSFALLCWGAALLIPPTGSGAPHLRVSTNIAASTAAMPCARAATRMVISAWW